MDSGDSTVTLSIDEGGEAVGPYLLRRVLGAGGMGEVMLAWDTRLERYVALKFLLERPGVGAGGRERFQREARAAAKLNHPNIVTVYEAGEIAERAYIAMEYVSGRALRQIMDTDSLSMQQTLTICRDLCRGLEEAHRHGVIHRDIKPTNIIVTDQACPKLVDFGLATIESEGRCTRSGMVLGTVNYMSPEQARGQAVDQRSDLFSLGVVLYEMLTGVCPFERGFTAATLHAIVHDPVAPLAEHGVRDPGNCQRVVDKALAKDPALRYESAATFGQDLDRVLRGETVEGLVGVEEAPRVREKSLAVLYMRNTGPIGDEHFSHALTEEITVELVKRAPFRVAPIRKVLKYRETDLEPEVVARRLGVTLLLDGSVAREGPGVRVMVELLDTGEDRTLLADCWTAPLEQLHGVLDEIVARVLAAVGSGGAVGRPRPVGREISNPAAYEFYLRGKFAFDRKTGQADVEAAAGLFRRALEMEPGLLPAKGGLARVLIQQAHYAKAEGLLLEALEEASRRGSEADESEFHRLLGAVHNRCGRNPEALEHLKRALELAGRAGDIRLEAEANALLLSAYCRMSRFREGEAVFERTLAICHQLDDQLPMVHALRYMGWLHLQCGHRIRARQMFASALQIAKRSKDAEAEAYVYNDIGMCYQAAVGYGLTIARDYLEKALQALGSLEDTANVATVMGNLGIVYQNIGDFGMALQYAEESSQRKKELGDRATFALYSANAASVLLSLGRYEEAVARADEAAAVGRQMNHAVAEVWAVAVGGFATYFTGDVERAVSLLQESLAGALKAELSQHASNAYSILGRIYYHTSRPEEARRHFEPGIEAARKFGHEHALLYCAAYLAAINGRAGDPEAYARRLERLRARAEGTYLEPSLMRLTGEVLLTSESAETQTKGRQVLHDALQMAERMRFAPEIMLIRQLLPADA